MAAQPDFADLLAFVGDRQFNGLRHRPACDHLLQTVQWAVFGMVPVGQQPAVLIQNFGFRHLFIGGDQHQRLARGAAIVKHYRRLHRIADGAGDQVQIVVGVGAQRKQSDQRQEDAGGADGDQRQAQVHALQHLAQRRSRMGGAFSAK